VNPKISPTDARILDILQRDGRRSFAEIGVEVGMSGPSAHERVKKLEARGIVRGFLTDERLFERDVPKAGEGVAGERGLSRLTRAGEVDDGEGARQLHEPVRQRSRDVGVLSCGRVGRHDRLSLERADRARNTRLAPQ